MQGKKKNEQGKQTILRSSITYLIFKRSALYRKSDQFMTQPQSGNKGKSYKIFYVQTTLTNRNKLSKERLYKLIQVNVKFKIFLVFFVAWCGSFSQRGEKLPLLYYYMRNFYNLICLEHWYFGLI